MASSSDYFSEDDPAFLDALNQAALPGDDQQPPPAQPCLKRRAQTEDDDAIYGPAHFDGFGEYMARKRAKLQIQNSDAVSAGTKNDIFKGLAVYVNGYTEPSVQELKALLVTNGGIYQPYLDRKSAVTHIVTCVLTEAKTREFKNMKVVYPTWLTESVKAGELLPWKDFIFVQNLAPKVQAPLPSATPRYAADSSNQNAQRAMANPGWRTTNTAVAPGFVKGYFDHSRLHFMSATKVELVQLVKQAQILAEEKMAQQDEKMVPDSPSPGKGKGRADEERVIMHCDFDCFFVSAGLITRPELRGQPVVVCHSQGTQGGGGSTSEIACASYEARKFGVKNGMSLQQARKLCPQVCTIPYEFERYKEVSLRFYTVLMSLADAVEAVSIDEALIDVTKAVARFQLQFDHTEDPAKAFAESIRAEVREATSCQISIGISYNILLARLATRRAKPAGAARIFPADVSELMATLDVTDLWGFANTYRDKARDKLGSSALSIIATKSRASLCAALGPKTGGKLYDAVRGIDHTALRSDKERKSVSAEINYAIRFNSNDDARSFLRNLAADVEQRLKEAKTSGRQITLKIMKRHPSAPVEAPKFMGHGLCEVFNKTQPLDGGRATSDSAVIAERAWDMLKSFNFNPAELRGVGIHITKLEPIDGLAAATDPKQTKLAFDTRVSANPAVEQVDSDVLAALPADVREELEHEWRRSESPRAIQRGSGPPRPRVGAPQQRQPTRMQQSGLKLGVRSAGYVIDKNSLHPNRPPNAFLRPTDADLRSLDIDPEVYAMLPRSVQREQLTRARLTKAGGVPEVSGERLVLKPKKYLPPPDLFRQPPPYAKYPDRPKLRQRTTEKVLFFTETDDVQGIIQTWVQAFRDFPPNEKDIEFFAKFLVQSVDSKMSTDTGVERAVSIVKWWLVLLRRYWGDYEHFDQPDEDEDGRVAMAWWRAFWSVKDQLDMVARKKFGGRLSIR